MSSSRPARDRSVLYARYWAFPRCGARRDVNDLAADNVAYRRSSLKRCEELWKDGFWEPRVHRCMKELGMRLRFDPDMWVAVRHPASVAGLAGQRFAHGWRFARQQLTSVSPGLRLLRVLGAPLVPGVLFLRICRALGVQGRFSLRHLVAASPLLMLYLISWSAGELVGYAGLRPARLRDRAAP